VNKLALCVGGISAAVAMTVIGAGNAGADAPDVTGEPRGKAEAILKSQGYKPVFGGGLGSDLAPSQCVVIDQTSMSGGRQSLRVNCTLAPGEEKPGAPNTHSLVAPGGSVQGSEGAEGGGARPTPGAGTVTVTPVPVG
jgi:hypothetical protein